MPLNKKLEPWQIVLVMLELVEAILVTVKGLETAEAQPLANTLTE
jgi:hypothetical protein